jgi:cyclopropane-fatty-acyl-phospholipid synthase
VPGLVPAASRALRWLAVARLRSTWTTGRLDLVMPGDDVIRIGEPGRADARIRIHDDRVWLRLLLRGEMGAGESFVAGEWSSDDVTACVRLFLRGAHLESPLTRIAQWPALARHRAAVNSHAGSRRNVGAHYDLGNAFYRTFLDDDTMSYSCAIWRGADTLAAAQHAKHERVCELLELSPRDHLLELGCGWGGMAIHAARSRGCRVTAITVSREQHRLASERVLAAGLADRIEIQFRDYRDLDGRFDKIVSIEMLEAIGYAFLPRYFHTCARLLAPGGRLAIQTITMPDDRFDAYRRRVDWMQTYVFPGSLIPSLAAIRTAAPMFELVHADDIGLDYVPTLRAWHDRFVTELAAIRALGFDESFIRTWRLYLAFSEAAFAERTLGDHQLLLSRRA